MSQVRVLYPPPQWRISSVGRAPIKDLNLCLGKFLIQEPEKQKFQKPETQTNVRLANLKAPISGCGGIGRHARLRIQCLCVRVQVSSPGPLYPAQRLGEEKPVSIPSWVFVQATTLNKQPAGSSLLLAKLLCSACRLVSTGSRVRSPGTITLRKVGYTVIKKRQPGRTIGNPSHLLNIWAHSSSGRAPALQAGGGEFEPRWVHHKIFGLEQRKYAQVTLLTLTSDTIHLPLKEKSRGSTPGIE